MAEAFLQSNWAACYRAESSGPHPILAKWSVPEPELTLLINPAAEIVGYTIGNDMSSRDIEGENSALLSTGKVYEGSYALGPGILLSSATCEEHCDSCEDYAGAEECIHPAPATTPSIKLGF